MKYEELRDLVYNYPTKHKEGFIALNLRIIMYM